MTLLSTRRLHELALGAIGVVLFAGAWEVIGAYRLVGLTWPPLSAVLAYLFDPTRRALFVGASAATFSRVGYGYLAGAALGTGLGAIVHAAPLLRPGADRLSNVINSIPAIALAPVLIVVFSREWTPVALAAVSVFFILYVATTSGLQHSSAGHRDLFRAIGASRWSRLSRLDLPAALPAIISGGKFAVPAAFIGTILGEWFGVSKGLGLLIVSAMQNFQIPLLWSAVLIASFASLVSFGIAGVIESFVYSRYRWR
jgi:ABC-type nitrate/sulfonate/bicarbonate transport system permease component